MTHQTVESSSPGEHLIHTVIGTIAEGFPCLLAGSRILIQHGLVEKAYTPLLHRASSAFESAVPLDTVSSRTSLARVSSSETYRSQTAPIPRGRSTTLEARDPTNTPNPGHHPRELFLFSDMLVWTHPETYRYQGHLELLGAQTFSDAPNSFAIATRDTTCKRVCWGNLKSKMSKIRRRPDTYTKTLRLRAGASEVCVWLRAIDDVISELAKKKEAGTRKRNKRLSALAGDLDMMTQQWADDYHASQRCPDRVTATGKVRQMSVCVRRRPLVRSRASEEPILSILRRPHEPTEKPSGVPSSSPPSTPRSSPLSPYRRVAVHAPSARSPCSLSSDASPSATTSDVHAIASSVTRPITKLVPTTTTSTPHPTLSPPPPPPPPGVPPACLNILRSEHHTPGLSNECRSPVCKEHPYHEWFRFHENSGHREGEVHAEQGGESQSLREQRGLEDGGVLWRPWNSTLYSTSLQGSCRRKPSLESSLRPRSKDGGGLFSKLRSNTAALCKQAKAKTAAAQWREEVKANFPTLVPWASLHKAVSPSLSAPPSPPPSPPPSLSASPLGLLLVA